MSQCASEMDSVPATSTPALRPSGSPVQITARSESVARSLDPLALARHLWSHRNLIWQFTRREVEGRYKGSFLGIFWSFVSPLALLAIYTFVGGVVLKIRWPGSRTGGLGEFALMLFAGLIAYSVFGECVSRAASLIVAVPSYVKKVVFPLEVLPVSVLGSALFHGVVSLAALFTFSFVHRGTLPWTIVFLPLAVLPLALLSLGLTWFLASLGVFLRDLGYAVPLLLQVVFFATPIMYPAESVPTRFRAALYLNPLAWTVESFRALIFRGALPDWVGLTAWTAIAGVVMLLGYAWFMKTRKGFADVL
jgi:lipopolysaccharide transport system permease protein